MGSFVQYFFHLNLVIEVDGTCTIMDASVYECLGESVVHDSWVYMIPYFALT